MNALFIMPQLFGISIEVYFILILICFLTFFFWNWLFKKFVKSDRKRILATWITTITFTPVIYVGLVSLWIVSLSYYPARDFDRAKWFAEKEKRYELSEDLIESELLIGKTEDEVRTLLGKPDGGGSGHTYYYNLGFRPHFVAIDPDYLDIYFEEGKVISVRQDKN